MTDQTPALTQRQAELLRVIVDYQAAHHGYAPTQDELAEATGTCRSVICKRLAMLERKGVIRRLAHKRRAIEVVALTRPTDNDVRPLFGPAIEAVLAERRRQVEDFGHEPDTDDRLPRGWLLRHAQTRLMNASDIVARNPGRAELLRAQRKTIQAAALCLAEFDRIERQLNQEEPRP